VQTAAQTLPESAFSLIELLLVLALILILTFLGAGQLTTSSRRRELAACGSNLQKIYVALSLYSNDNGAYPFIKTAQSSTEPLSLLIPKCTTDTGIFICPASGDKALPEGEPFAKHRISYDYYMGRTTNDDPNAMILSDWQVDALPKKRGQIIFSPDGKGSGHNHKDKGGNLVTCAGALVFSTPQAARDFVFPSTVKLLEP
jgi:type II secretory pathway pseudopilin PulG